MSSINTNPSDTFQGQVVEEKNPKTNEIKKYTKGKFLGKGGFAKCYEFTIQDSKQIVASKIIPKSSLTKSRAKQKLMSEIKIHRSLHHQNIVGFVHFFEDFENVYILLELCQNQTMNELIRRRKRLTELEVQCYLVQILSALKYLHKHRVIHRDLKLGNLFISDKMEIKLGDFGLATKLEYDGERKRTICGTPNYIAPEILEGKKGHSYEVDIWSLGVIMYTLLIGKPPFETNDVKTTYKRIKMNAYSFPEHVVISPQAKDLIQKILNNDPALRPSIDDILAHDFFHTSGQIPKYLPISTLALPPSASYLRQFLPQNNKDKEMSVGKNSPKKLEATAPINIQSKQLLKERKDFMNTDRPVNQLLNNYDTNNINNDNIKLDTMQGTACNVNGNNNYLQGTGILDSNNKNGVQPIVMASNQQQQENMLSVRNSADKFSCYKNSQQKLNDNNPNANNLITIKQPQQTQQQQLPTSQMRSQSQQQFQSSNLYKNQVIPTNNLNTISNGQNEIYVKKWVDYSSKYGLGYLLSNGQSGAFFNDSTKILLDPQTSKFQYVERKGQEREDVISVHSLSDFPPELQKKVTLIQHFKNYLEGDKKDGNQAVAQNPANNNAAFDPTSNIYVKKWYRTRYAIMFRLNNKVVQVIFQDQTEIILSSELKIVTYVNKRHERLTYPLANALESTNQEMSKRLRYTKDILTHMLGNGQNQHETKQTKNPESAEVNQPENKMLTNQKSMGSLNKQQLSADLKNQFISVTANINNNNNGNIPANGNTNNANNNNINSNTNLLATNNFFVGLQNKPDNDNDLRLQLQSQVPQVTQQSQSNQQFQQMTTTDNQTQQPASQQQPQMTFASRLQKSTTGAFSMTGQCFSQTKKDLLLQQSGQHDNLQGLKSTASLCRMSLSNQVNTFCTNNFIAQQKKIDV